MTRRLVLTLFCVFAQCAFSEVLTVTQQSVGISPLYSGVNLGHRADPSWLSFVNYLGVNAARLFGMNGIGEFPTLRALSTSGGGTWGTAQDGSLVSDRATFGAAMSDLISQTGHNPNLSSLYVNPVQWTVIENNFDYTASNSVYDEIIGNAKETVDALRVNNIALLPNQEISCEQFSFTSFNKDNASFWGERWELYKHQFAIAVWSYKKDLYDFELDNEPDLDACNFVDTTWLDILTIRSQAIRDAFDALNNDVAAGRLECPSFFCPMTPHLMASAFAKPEYSLEAGVLSELTILNKHLDVPALEGITDDSISNFDSFSFTSYEQSGSAMLAQANFFKSSIENTLQDPMNVYVTAHAAHSAEVWNSLETNSDTPLEAATLASQLMYSASNGFSTYVQQMTQMPGSEKNGLTFANIVSAPFSVSDVTVSGEMMAMISRHISGAKPVKSCSIANAQCLVIEDPHVHHVWVLADSADTSVTFDLSALALPANSYAILHTLGSINQVARSSQLSPFVLSSYDLMHATITKNAQQISTFAPIADAQLCAGMYTQTNFGANEAMVVGTSTTDVHTTTCVSFIKFDIYNHTSFANAANSVVLELTVDAPSTEPFKLAVYGIAAETLGTISESAATWSSVGILKTPLDSIITSTNDNFILNIGAGNNIAGHITVDPSDAGVAKQINVTDYVSRMSRTQYTEIGFVIARIFRNDVGTSAVGAIAADTLNGGASVLFKTKESSSAPTLRIFADATVVQQPVNRSPPPPSPPLSPPPPSPPPPNVDLTYQITGEFNFIFEDLNTVDQLNLTLFEQIISEQTSINTDSITSSVASIDSGARRLLEINLRIFYKLVVQGSLAADNAKTVIEQLTFDDFLALGIVLEYDRTEPQLSVLLGGTDVVSSNAYLAIIGGSIVFGTLLLALVYVLGRSPTSRASANSVLPGRRKFKYNS